MWRSLWRSIDRFSLQHFKYVINELRGIKIVDKHNSLVVDLLQSIAEIVTYGDRQDPLIFECFMEYQVLAEFVRVLKISRNSRIEAPLLQYLSIMIQNMDSEHAIYYCLSNGYINSIIAHQYNFDGGDLAPYYISFLRAVSSKINRDTLCLLVRVHADVVVSFPLYSEALKFAQHGEKMIQTAVRALTLNIYNVSDDMVYQFVSIPPASKYFSDLVHSLKEQCVHLDSLVLATEGACTDQIRKELLLETDKIVDDLYYFKDILSVGESRLSEVVTQNLLNLFVFPILLPLLKLRRNDGSNLSAITSLYIVSRLLQVVGGKTIVNAVAEIVLYPFMSSLRYASEGDANNLFFNHLNNVEKLGCSDSESEGGEIINGHLIGKPVSSHSPSINCSVDDSLCRERGGILAFILSENHCLLLASLFLLFTLAGSKDVEQILASMIGLSGMQCGMDHDISASQVVDKIIFVKFMPQILNSLLKVLASEPLIPVQIQWHTVWFLQKLLVLQGKKLDDQNLQIFNTSYEQSSERFKKELDGCWFDYILDTLRNEWTSCKAALEKPSQSKDPFFILELAVCQKITDDATSAYFSWQRMVDTVKVFILHLQLKAFICKGELLEKPLLAPLSSPAGSGRTHASDLSSASFGSEISLGSGIPCRIAFSNAGIRDIYMIPLARGTSGKLLLVEKHPFRSQQGVIIAITPLAGLSPKIDEDHPTWLHLRIREFDPRLNASKTKGYNAKGLNHAAEGRWTLGFPNAKACEAARLSILEEINKQKSSVRSTLAPLLQDNSDGSDEGSCR
ncbi:protein TRANSPARENT TESTA 9 isoform X2 [Hevea brasiliensis]|uniref:protein TRANSPARENT TESTA 9 isoform X2 n=1 Tax=Hevea brasiliensis TaxID=3981 RepID=UPI0025F8BA68|nr:protein TRANSPARENT TESTA 9 isoform X2 [Hevea brasiliensis]